MLMLKNANNNRMQMIPIKNIITPHNDIRTYYKTNEFQSLCASIKKQGIIKPLTVKAVPGGKFRLVSGERRFKAARTVGLIQVPCYITQINEEDILFQVLIESFTLSVLNYFEIAVIIERIHEEFSLSYTKIGERLGLSLAKIYTYLNYLSFTPVQQKKMLENGVTQRHADILLQLKEPDRDIMLNEVIEQRFNLTQTKRRCSEALAKGAKNRKPLTFFRDVTIFINTIEKAVTTMQESGIKAECMKTDYPECVEFRVMIPK